MTRECCNTTPDCYHRTDCPNTSEDDGMRTLQDMIQARGKQSAAHVRTGLPRAYGGLLEGGHVFTMDERTDLGGIPLLTSRVVPDGQALLATDPGTGAAVVFVGEHDEQAAAVIAAELVACTLGARCRPELRMSPQARLGAILERVGARVRERLAAFRAKVPANVQATL